MLQLTALQVTDSSVSTLDDPWDKYIHGTMDTLDIQIRQEIIRPHMCLFNWMHFFLCIDFSNHFFHAALSSSQSGLFSVESRQPSKDEQQSTEFS